MTAAEVHPLRAMLIRAGVLAPQAPEPPRAMEFPTGPVAVVGDLRAQRYVDKALRDECTTMATAQPGTRNDTLNRCAYKLGSLVSAGHLGRDAMVEGLWNAARQAGLADTEIRQTLRSGARAGADSPRVLHLADRLDSTPGPLWLNEDGHIPPAESGPGPDTEDTPEAEETKVRPEILPTLDLDKLLSEPLDGPDWLAEPLIEEGGLYALFSPAKAGKSLFTLDMVAALAAGKPCLGYPAKPPVHVLYVDYENGRRDLQQRFTDLGYKTGDLSDHLHYLHFPPMPMLDTAAGARYLYFNAKHYQARLVVIDTVSRAIAGDENASDTWHALYRLSMVALKREGIAVLRLDHMGKDADKGMRGSSAKLSDVDAAFRLERTYDNRIRLVREVTRNGNSPEVSTYEQLSGPLRHEPCDETSSIRADVNHALRLLDQIGVPLGFGRDKTRAMLKQAGMSVGNDILARAISIRKLQVSEPFSNPEGT